MTGLANLIMTPRTRRKQDGNKGDMIIVLSMRNYIFSFEGYCWLFERHHHQVRSATELMNCKEMTMLWITTSYGQEILTWWWHHWKRIVALLPIRPYFCLWASWAETSLCFPCRKSWGIIVDKLVEPGKLSFGIIGNYSPRGNTMCVRQVDGMWFANWTSNALPPWKPTRIDVIGNTKFWYRDK
jgi:hypothetical protein